MLTKPLPAEELDKNIIIIIIEECLGKNNANWSTVLLYPWHRSDGAFYVEIPQCPLKGWSENMRFSFLLILTAYGNIKRF